MVSAARVSRASRDSEAVRKEPITVTRILAAAFHLVETEGFEALTMRRVAAALETGPASLYAHVRNKAELDDLMIGELCARIDLPEPDPATWRGQILDVCRQLRDQYLRFPGISRAALASAPNDLETLRLSEGMLSLLLVGGVRPGDAAWAIDAAYLYVSAYSLEASLRGVSESGDARSGSGSGSGSGDARSGSGARDAGVTAARFADLPADLFPNTIRYARELTSGEGHERFDFTLELLFRGLATA